MSTSAVLVREHSREVAGALGGEADPDLWDRYRQGVCGREGIGLMKVQVFGSGGGCTPCEIMLRDSQAAVAELRVASEAEYVTRIQLMLELGIAASPALVVDGQVKCVGRALDIAEIKTILAAPAAETTS